jgi:hypothetical protein
MRMPGLVKQRVRFVYASWEGIVENSGCGASRGKKPPYSWGLNTNALRGKHDLMSLELGTSTTKGTEEATSVL